MSNKQQQDNGQVESELDQDKATPESGMVNIDDMGMTGGVGLPEMGLPEELAIDDIERREILVNPSDLQDVGDPEAGDVGVAGGLAAGGEMGEGGYGHIGDDPWGLELMVDGNAAAAGVELGDSQIGEGEEVL